MAEVSNVLIGTLPQGMPAQPFDFNPLPGRMPRPTLHFELRLDIH